MLTPLALFLSLLVATAFIAHWSDNLGKKLGKKRVSVFGLRPRTSATLLTVVSSWAIMAFTLAALLLTVTPLKTALFSYDAARDRFATDLKIAQSKTDDVQKNYESTSAKLKEASANLNQANAKTDRANQAKERAEQGAKTAVKNQQTAQRAEQVAKNAEQAAKRGEQAALAAARTASSQANTAVVQANTARASLGILTRALDQKKSDLNRVEFNLKTVQFNLRRATTQVNRLSSQVNTLTYRSRSLQKQVFARGQQVFSQGNQILQQGRSIYQSQAKLTQAQARLTQTQAQLAQARAEFIGVQRQQNELKKDALFVASSAHLLAYNDIALPVDQTLTEQRLPSRLSPTEAQAQLRALVERSQEAARNFLQNNDNESLAKVVEVVLSGSDKDNQKSIYLNPDQWIKVYGNIISKQKESVLLRLVVSSNYSSDTLKNFPLVEARLLFVHQDALYSKNQLICEGTIDGTQGEASVYGALTNLIEVARRRAVSHGASPPLSPEAPTFFASDTGDRIFDAKSQVQKTGRRVAVRILAARDLNTAEPLQIRFQVGDSSAT